MKIKRILSTVLIALTLLCSTEGFSQIALVINDQPNEDSEYVKFSQSLSLDFRESFKISISEETESQLVFVGSNFPNVNFVTSSFGRYRCYTKAYLFNSPSKKRFIDFGSILI